MTTSTIERRAITRPVELRAEPDGGATLVGYAAVYNRFSQNLGGFVEQVDPAAFTKSLADSVPVLARYNHDDNWLLGTTEGGTLVLESDGVGLRYEITLPDTGAGRDVKALAGRGDLRYSSFAFRTIDAEWSLTPDGFPLRTLLAVQLVDVAPVNSPAYRDTTTALRALSDRTGLPVTDLDNDHLEQIRAALSGTTTTTTDTTGQGDTHPLLSAAQRRLTLLSHSQ